MNRKVALLRLCCWLGAILDARAAILLTLLRYRDLPAGMAAQKVSREFGIQTLWGAGDAAALMWGWTALLIWADRKPVERRSVLLLTSAPVILLLLVGNSQLWLAGFAGFGQIAFLFFFLIGLGLLFGFSYVYASSESKPEQYNVAGSQPATKVQVS